MKYLLPLIIFLNLLFFSSCQTSKKPEVPASFSDEQKYTWLKKLELRMIHKHIGGGEYSIDKDSIGYEIYSRSVNEAKTLAEKGLERYSNYKIITNASGAVVDGKKLGDFYFGDIVRDFYSLGLAIHIEPSDTNKLKAKNFIHWLKWNGFSRKVLDRKSEYYLGGLGRAFFLCQSVMSNEDRDFAIKFLFGEVSDSGKAGVAKALHIAEYGPIDKEIGYRQNDVLRGRSESLICAVLLLPDSTPEEKQYKLQCFQSVRKALLLGVTPSKGVYGFIKPDMTASHHMYHYVSAYTPQGLSSLAAMVNFISNSPWQLNSDELFYLNGTVRETYFYGHHDTVPLGLSGRMFSNNMLEQTYSMLPLTITANTSDNLNLLQTFCDTYRNAMGTAYTPISRLNQQGFPGYASAFAQTLEKAEQHKLKPKVQTRVKVYPYSPAIAMKNDNWTAFAKGMSKWWWSYEGGITASNPQAIFGIYKSHGALEIKYRDPKDPSGGKTLNPSIRKGMDMSHLPGSTTPARTDEDMINDVIGSRLKIDSTSVGGVHLNNQFGLFMFDLKNTPGEMKDPGFTAKKSYFFNGDEIIMLGTGINSKSDKYPVHTTLFQNYLDQDQADQSPLIDSFAKKITAIPYSQTLENDKSSILLDSEGTGYYIPKNQKLQIERKKVQWAPMTQLPKGNRKDIISRQKAARALKKESSFRSLAWIDHGKLPQNSSYEYVLLPASNYSKLQNYRQRQDDHQLYEFKEKSAAAHILYHKDHKLWSYALYDDYKATDKGPLNEVKIHKILAHEHEEVDAHPAYAIMLQETEKHELNFALSFLDLRLRQDYDTGLAIKKEGGVFFGSAPVIVKVLLKGKWELKKPLSNVKLQHLDNQTQLLIKCQDGLSRNLTLEKN